MHEYYDKTRQCKVQIFVWQEELCFVEFLDFLDF